MVGGVCRTSQTMWRPPLTNHKCRYNGVVSDEFLPWHAGIEPARYATQRANENAARTNFGAILAVKRAPAISLNGLDHKEGTYYALGLSFIDTGLIMRSSKRTTEGLCSFEVALWHLAN